MSLPGLEAFRIKKTVENGGVFQLHVELDAKPHRCPVCNVLTKKVHDYRTQKIQHSKLFVRETLIFYRKRRYKCEQPNCEKRFYENNSLVERYQRQSKELKQAIALELIHGKNFKSVASRFNISSTTVMRRFDEVGSSFLKETKELPSVIAIDEYKGDSDGEKYQTIIADPVDRKPLEILPDRKKETVETYLKEHGQRVEVVVMDMSPATLIRSLMNEFVIPIENVVPHNHWSGKNCPKNLLYQFGRFQDQFMDSTPPDIKSICTNRK
ncbi:MAG: helix-turn-helix domain-containing protein [Bacillota bacterium]